MPPAAMSTDADAAAAATDALSSMSLSYTAPSLFVLRPNFGTAGRATTLQTNHFPLTSIPDGIIYQYDITIGSASVVRPARANMQIFLLLAEAVPALKTAAYDGKKNVYTMSQMEEKITVELPGFTAKAKTLSVTLKRVQEINTEPLKLLISGKGQVSSATMTAIAAINSAFRHTPISKFSFNSRSFLTNQETAMLGSGVEMWRGYYSSVRATQLGLQLNLDTSAAAMVRADISIPQLAVEFLGLRAVADLAPCLAKDAKAKRSLIKFLRNVRVRVDVGAPSPTSPSAAAAANPSGPKVFAIKNITPESSDKLFFEIEVAGAATKQKSSVSQYFKRQFNVNLRFPNLPCLEAKPGVAFPMELCTALPGQLHRAKLDPNQTRACLEFTTRKPDERLGTIRNGLSLLAAQTSPQVKAMGISLGSQLTKVPARVLQPPTIQYNPTGKVKTARCNLGSWNLVGAKFCKPVAISRWSVVIFGRQDNPRFRADQVKIFIDTFVNTLKATGITFANPKPPVSYANPNFNIEAALKTAGDQASVSTTVKGRPELIICILPDAGTDLYASIKRWGDVTMGVPTQCMLLKNLTKPRGVDQYCANVAMKVNAKLGGVNATLAPGTSPLLDKGNTIFVAVDVVHPEPGSSRPSIAAFVSSQDKAAGSYFAQTRVLGSRVEVVDNAGIKMMMTEALKRFFVVNKVKPAKIIFLRDGVGEGMYAEVVQKEINSIKEACTSLEPGYNPTITACVVGKRHHVRFFPSEAKDADRSGNALAGTVVDRGIAHPTEFDFYLLSHGGLLGTSRPAHYIVVKDENKFTADEFQKLMFSLTHVYARATRSVSIPPAIYYADIVADRARFHFASNFDDSDTASVMSGDSKGKEAAFDAWCTGYKPIHDAQKFNQYYM